MPMPIARQPLVSILTPVYNGEKYLAECIESVLAQTYTNWEYVIINNCSTDHSLEIAQQYAGKDSRIHIHTNCEFVDVIRNHNIAFRQISPESKYCKVLHADDWIFPECIMRMVEVAEAHPSVGIVGAYRLDDVRVSLDGLPYPSTVIPGRELCRATLLGGPYVFGSPTSLLIRAECIRKHTVFYDESPFFLQADQASCFEVLQHTDFGFVHQVLTYTRRHSETATAYARKMNTYLIGGLMILKKYGPIYLSPTEYEEYFKHRMSSYYRFLAQNMRQWPDKQFQDFHRTALKNLAESFSVAKLAKAVLLELTLSLLCPAKPLKKLIRSLQNVIRSVHKH